MASRLPMATRHRCRQIARRFPGTADPQRFAGALWFHAVCWLWRRQRPGQSRPRRLKVCRDIGWRLASGCPTHGRLPQFRRPAPGLLADAQARGVREALRALDLESLAGRPITEIFLGLTDYICPGAGTVDEGIAQEAYIETIVELVSEGLTDLTTFTPDQMQTVFELYATHAIEARICNDIGTKAVTMPAGRRLRTVSNSSCAISFAGG